MTRRGAGGGKGMSLPSWPTVVRMLVIAIYVVPLAFALISPMAAVWGGGKKH